MRRMDTAQCFTRPALIVFFVLFSAAVIGILAVRPGFTTGRAGKILGFVAMFCLPIFCGLLGLSREMDRSKTTAFCLSCHTMEDYGKSLLVDDPTHIPAAHYQNHRVPPDEACYSCHTQYAMFGGLKVKLYGLKHVFIYYFGTPPAPAGHQALRAVQQSRMSALSLGGSVV